MKLCGISKAHAYRLISALMDKGSIAFIPGYGFVAVNRRHLDLILATYELILDAVRSNGVLDEPLSSYYGVKLSKVTLHTLMGLALMHAITSSGGIGSRGWLRVLESLGVLRRSSTSLMGL
jgi:hypothetical protein